MQLIRLIRDQLFSLVREESGQDTFEYLLIIGGVTVAVIFAVAVASPSLIKAVINGVCSAIGNINVTVVCT